jgi:hypothetical protein
MELARFLFARLPLIGILVVSNDLLNRFAAVGGWRERP